MSSQKFVHDLFCKRMLVIVDIQNGSHFLSVHAWLPAV